MLVLLFVVLLTANIDYTLQCLTNCSVGGFRFDQPFRIPKGQCQQRISASNCSVEIKFRYPEQMYYADFDSSPLESDSIYIGSGPYLSYSIDYRCSKGTDCDLSDAQNRINELVGRAYDAERIYGQLAPLIESRSSTDSIQCYNTQNEIITCLRNQICALDYNQLTEEIRSRGCVSEYRGSVSVYDGGCYASLKIECARNLCNDNATVTQIKTILADNGLTDSNGRRIAAGRKEMASFFLVTFTLISVIVSYF